MSNKNINWKYKDEWGNLKEINDLKFLSKNYLIKNLYGFIYKIKYKSGHYYIGKKVFFYNKDKLIKAKEKFTIKSDKEYYLKEIVDIKRTTEYKKAIYCLESDWKTYKGSCRSDIIKNNPIIERQILLITKDKLSLSFFEHIIISKYIFDKKCLNGNVGGRYYKNKLNFALAIFDPDIQEYMDR